MDRTPRAVMLAGFVTFAAVAGGGLFLGFDPAGSLIVGLVLGILGGALIWAAARRADSFHDGELPTPVKPSFPGPPERPDGTVPDEPEGPPGGPDAPGRSDGSVREDDGRDA